MNGPEQNSPTLVVVNDDTTSGAFDPPARRAWLILSSVTLPVTSTVMFGLAASKASTLSWIALTSLGALQPCQNLMVTWPELGSEPPPPPLLPVQALASSSAGRAIAAAAIARTLVTLRTWRTLRALRVMVGLLSIGCRGSCVGWSCRPSSTARRGGRRGRRLRRRC